MTWSSSLLCALSLAGVAVCGIGCGPPEPTVMIYPQGGSAARGVLDLRWTTKVTLNDLFVLRPDELSAATVDHERGLVYAGSRRGMLLGLSMTSGRVAWEHDFSPSAPTGAGRITADGKHLIFGTDDGALVALDLETRAVAWSYQTEGSILEAPAITPHVAYFTNSHQDVFALTLAAGEWKWQYSRDVISDVSTIYGRAGVAFVTGDTPADDAPNASTDVLLACFDDGQVAALSAASGEPIWVSSVAPAAGGPFVDCDSTPLVTSGGDEVVVAGQETGIHGLGFEDGQPRWMFPVRGAGTVVQGPGDSLLFSSSLQGVFAIEPGGRVRWRQQFDPGSLSAPVRAQGLVFVGHSEQGLMVLSAHTGELLARVDTGSGVSATPAYDAQNETLLVLTNRGDLLAFDVHN